MQKNHLQDACIWWNYSLNTFKESRWLIKIELKILLFNLNVICCWTKQFQTYSRSLVCPFMRWHGLEENISLKKRTPLPCVHHTSCYISHKSIDYFHPRFLVPQRPGGLHPKINFDMLNFVTKNCTGNINTVTHMNQKHIYLSCKEFN